MCRCACVCSLCLLVCCAGTGPEQAHIEFSVVDVGQGLAQLVMAEGDAVAFDMGPADAAPLWRNWYRQVGEPWLVALVLSHSDEDHRGGLGQLDSLARFSGTVYVNPYEDTAFVRATAGAWRHRVRFVPLVTGDTVGGLDGVRVECLWPPGGLPVCCPVPPEQRNHLSLVCVVSHGHNRVLLTSDIDTVTMQWLISEVPSQISASMVVVPHHGSASSVDRLFYGWACPRLAVVSCGCNNDYGHPSLQLVDVLFDLGIPMRTTCEHGTLHAASNGEYWTVVH